MIRLAKSLGLLGLLLLIAATGAQAAVDGWVLALTWHPGYCARNHASPECRVERAPGLVLHGLWPEADKESAEFCAATASLRKIDYAREWCRFPPLKLETSTAAALDKVMPGRADCLDRHEWFRHGTCSGMKADRYFRIAAAVVERINGMELGRFLKESAGKEVRTADLVRAAVRDAGPQARPAYSFICHGRGKVHLSEVWIAMSYLGPWLFPQRGTMRAQHMSVGHACPQNGTILIDGTL
jgi:ribonuclease I